jgi:hypothetical protein
MHLNGTGVLEDFVAGYMASNLAAALGNEVAKENKMKFANRITRD